MKYLKVFEEEQKPTFEYYIIQIDKSFDKFVIALDKLGFKKGFYDEWGLTDDEYAYDDIIPENKDYFEKDIVYLGVYADKNHRIEHDFPVASSLKELKTYAYEAHDVKKLVYKGTIKIEDYEIDARQYNL